MLLDVAPMPSVEEVVTHSSSLTVGIIVSVIIIVYVIKKFIDKNR